MDPQSYPHHRDRPLLHCLVAFLCWYYQPYPHNLVWFAIYILIWTGALGFSVSLGMIYVPGRRADPPTDVNSNINRTDDIESNNFNVATKIMALDNNTGLAISRTSQADKTAGKPITSTKRECPPEFIWDSSAVETPKRIKARPV